MLNSLRQNPGTANKNMSMHTHTVHTSLTHTHTKHIHVQNGSRQESEVVTICSGDLPSARGIIAREVWGVTPDQHASVRLAPFPRLMVSDGGAPHPIRYDCRCTEIRKTLYTVQVTVFSEFWVDWVDLISLGVILQCSKKKKRKKERKQ